MAIISGAINRPKVFSGAITFPASYTTGGFTVDLSASVDVVHFFDIVHTLGSSLQDVEFEFTYNRNTTTDALGVVLVKVVMKRNDQASVGNISGLPGGVTAQSAVFAAATTSGSSHTHTMDHDHPAVTSATETASGALGVNLAAGGPNMRNHTHDFDIPAFTGSTGAGTHTHDRFFEYEHQHPTTQVQTNLTRTEVVAGTNLSAATARFWAVGV